MKLSLAVAGKGGTGKTTLAALVVRSLREIKAGAVLAVDADPTSNLAEALGVDSGIHLSSIREKGATPEGSPSSGVGRARAIDDEIQRAITEASGFDLVTMGAGEGPSCYCYVNNLLRQSLESLSRSYDAIVLDNEAGLEHLSRRTTNNVDFLIAVMNPTMPSFRAVKRIIQLSRELPVRIDHRLLLVNRMRDEGLPAEVERQLADLDVERLPDIPQDDAVERAGAEEQNVFTLSDQAPAVVAVKKLVESLRDRLGK